MNYFVKRMRAGGYKLTPQRRYIFNALSQSDGKHFTAEDIHHIIEKGHPEIGLATVYRSLKIFMKLELIDALYLDDGTVRYELHDVADKHRHHHLICQSCDRITCVEDDMLEDVEKIIKKKYGFTVTNHAVKFYGRCKDCEKDNNKK